MFFDIQINVFKGILDNKLFIVIVFGILGLQILLVTFTSSAFHVYQKGLTIQQWAICIAIGFISMPVNLLLKVKTLNEEQKVYEEKNESQMEIRSESVSEPVKQQIKDEMATDSNLIKVKEMAKYPSSFNYKIPPLKHEKTQVIKIGFK